jgi:hypothetical protein
VAQVGAGADGDLEDVAGGTPDQFGAHPVDRRAVEQCAHPVVCGAPPLIDPRDILAVRRRHAVLLNGLLNGT